MIDGVYVNDRARRELGWSPQYDFLSVVNRLQAAAEWAANWPGWSAPRATIPQYLQTAHFQSSSHGLLGDQVENLGQPIAGLNKPCGVFGGRPVR